MWVRSSSAAALLMALAAGATSPQEPLRIVRERTFSLDMLIDPQPNTVSGTAGAAGVAWRTDVRSRFPQGGGLDGIRVDVRFDERPGPEHTLRFVDAAGRELEAVVDPPQEFWSREAPEGVVYRIERKGRVIDVAKWVRPDKVDGELLPENTGREAVWNWRP